LDGLSEHERSAQIEGRHASQLEVLEIIHFTLLILLRLGDFRIRVAFTLAASATFLLDVTVHFPRKRVHIVAETDH